MCGAASRTCTTTTSRDASPHHAAPLARRPSASALRLAFVDIRVEVFCDLQLPCWHGADARDLHRLTCRIAPRLLRATIIMPGACSWRQLKVIRRRPLDHGSPDGSVPDEVRGGHHEYSSSAPDIAFLGGGTAALFALHCHCVALRRLRNCGQNGLGSARRHARTYSTSWRYA